jgi:hypothetical protein
VDDTEAIEEGAAEAVATGADARADDDTSRESGQQLEAPDPSATPDPSTLELSTLDPSAAIDSRADSSIDCRTLQPKRLQLSKPEERVPSIGSHQSVASVCTTDGGYCQYNQCPGFLRLQNKRRRAYPTIYICEECSINQGFPVCLCNTVKVRKSDGSKIAILC